MEWWLWVLFGIGGLFGIVIIIKMLTLIFNRGNSNHSLTSQLGSFASACCSKLKSGFKI